DSFLVLNDHPRRAGQPPARFSGLTDSVTQLRTFQHPMGLQIELVERSNGAIFSPLGGHQLPQQFGDPEAEWTAVRRSCGVLDARFRCLLRLTGSDRITFLQGMVSNDVARLGEGEGTYATLLTQQGKLVSDLRIYVLADEVWLGVPVICAAAVRENLERYIIADDVEFVSDDAWAALVAIEGPLAARTVLGVIGENAEDLAPFAHRPVTFNGVPARLIAASHSGEAGYVLCGHPDTAAGLW